MSALEAALTHDELARILRARRLNSAGDKPTLVRRILENSAAAAVTHRAAVRHNDKTQSLLLRLPEHLFLSLCLCQGLSGGDLARLEATARHFHHASGHLSSGVAAPLTECAAEQRARPNKMGWRVGVCDEEHLHYLGLQGGKETYKFALYLNETERHASCEYVHSRMPRPTHTFLPKLLAADSDLNQLIESMMQFTDYMAGQLEMTPAAARERIAKDSACQKLELTRRLTPEECEAAAFQILGWENGINTIMRGEQGRSQLRHTVAMMALLRAKKLPGPFLVIAPLAKLADWQREISEGVGQLSARIYHGHQDQDCHWVWPSCDVIITSFEVCGEHAKKFQFPRFARGAGGDEWKCLVLDMPNWTHDTYHMARDIDRALSIPCSAGYLLTDLPVVGASSRNPDYFLCTLWVLVKWCGKLNCRSNAVPDPVFDLVWVVRSLKLLLGVPPVAAVSKAELQAPIASAIRAVVTGLRENGGGGGGQAQKPLEEKPLKTICRHIEEKLSIDLNTQGLNNLADQIIYEVSMKPEEVLPAMKEKYGDQFASTVEAAKKRLIERLMYCMRPRMLGPMPSPDEFICK
jgi:hypothetical protein